MIVFRDGERIYRLQSLNVIGILIYFILFTHLLFIYLCFNQLTHLIRS